jgi:hypothetical protein
MNFMTMSLTPRKQNWKNILCEAHLPRKERQISARQSIEGKENKGAEMIKDFIIYYLLYNEPKILTILMLYVLIGAITGLVCITVIGFLNSMLAYADNTATTTFPNFFKFTAFWGLWMSLEIMEMICKKWCIRYLYTILGLADKFSNWMYV